MTTRWLNIAVVFACLMAAFCIAVPLMRLSSDHNGIFMSNIHKKQYPLRIPKISTKKRFLLLKNTDRVLSIGPLSPYEYSRKLLAEKLQTESNNNDDDYNNNNLRPKRSFKNAVIEGANCEHIELIDCDNYTTNDMECMVTATGMTCCICTGELKKEFTDYSIFR
ncbi:unnamed protein product [Enterobius vermicularis]|uniref:HMA domain-containing protein n=1 Tax=Enterobius vermicularis TaxID=51028 RepID=A0A158QAC6_ENTVE|nr:unnamed protein product [Enterobius vermicularis]